ncbi:MAG: FG-GAP-like repeat-containing protein, partial [Pseudonocardiaceae bacterium]
MADIDADGRPDIVLLMVDDPPGQNTGYYRVGHAVDGAGNLSGGWSDWQRIPDWFSAENDAAGIAVADVNGNGQLDVIVYMIDAPAGANQGYYRVGWSLDPTTATVTGGWSDWQQVPDWFSWINAGGDITVADVDGDGRLDLVVFMVDAPDGPNAGYYRSGPLELDGTVKTWRPWQAVPDWRFWENQGAGIAVADLDGDGTAELVVLAVDNPVGQNGAYYSVGWRLDSRGRPADGWGPWLPVPDWGFWENQGGGVATTPLGPAHEPHLVVLAIDNPPEQNGAYYRVLDAMTDLQMAPQMGVWRLLEQDSGTLAVHAALLHTGDVIFFAGSSNDPDRHNAHQYGTTVWHYPGPDSVQPVTPVDLFCVGHAFLPDGRLLAAGGTEQYDPFLGLRQSITFDPVALTWTPQQQMAGGRWYPSLLTLGDGRVLATAGLDETSMLNIVPEMYTDGVGWAQQPVSSHWPSYGHLFLLADGRVFYSGGQYGDNNGVRPAIWDMPTNSTIDVPGLPAAGSRNQSSSVLLPPAQAQQVMIIGGGPYDMHNQAGATAS